MKTVTFKNRMNNDRVVCEDTRAIKFIDGVEYLLVKIPRTSRQLLMRKDALEKVKEKS